MPVSTFPAKSDEGMKPVTDAQGERKAVSGAIRRARWILGGWDGPVGKAQVCLACCGPAAERDQANLPSRHDAGLS
jgi:hypothetical protein